MELYDIDQLLDAIIYPETPEERDAAEADIVRLIQSMDKDLLRLSQRAGVRYVRSFVIKGNNGE